MPVRRISSAFAASFAVLALPPRRPDGRRSRREDRRRGRPDPEGEPPPRRGRALPAGASSTRRRASSRQAVKEFRKAVELDPTDGALRREYAELLRDLPIYPGGREGGPQGRRARARRAPARTGSSARCSSRPRRTSRACEEAAAELKKANELAPADPQGAVAYAQVLLRLDKPKEASAVLEAGPGSGARPAVLLLYGEALERSGQLRAGRGGLPGRS